jgi:hypothetical protein
MKQCCICFSIKPNCKSSCNHYFCKSCIINWLNIKENCPLCRCYLNDYLLEDINNNNYSLRSKTYKRRRLYIVNTTNFYLVKIKNMNYTIEEKIKFLDELFKIAYENISVIKKEKELNNLLKESVINLKNDPIIIDNGYLDKIKLWDYKFKQLYSSYS